MKYGPHWPRSSEMPADPNNPGKHINPETGIWPVSDWGNECMRGFVSSSRFGGGTVIARTNRETTRKWRREGGQRALLE